MEKLMRSFAPQVGFLNSRKTGTIVLDMAIAITVPMVIQSLAVEWSLARTRLWSFVRHLVQGNVFYRTVEFEKTTSPFAPDEDTSEECKRNNILQRAILLYIGQLDLRYPHAQVLLSSVKEKGTRDDSDDSYRRMCGGSKMVYGSTSEQLKAYKVHVAPATREWVVVADGIHFCMSSIIEGGGKGPQSGRSSSSRKQTVTFKFMCRLPDGDKRIQSFIDRAFHWYCTAMAATEDQSRYLYSLQVDYTPRRIGAPMAMGCGTFTRGKKLSGATSMSVHRYKRYKLGNVKTFDSLFFPEKEGLLTVLQNFGSKTGKYAIKGYPHKLGLLLHGPPGTGKTSLIKALAHHTRRHIISVPLARISTNQDLMDIMFDQSFRVSKLELPASLSFENVIFVMEDVDAASSIVRSRDRTATRRKNKRRRAAARKARASRKRLTQKAREEASAASLTATSSVSGTATWSPPAIQPSSSAQPAPFSTTSVVHQPQALGPTSEVKGGEEVEVIATGSSDIAPGGGVPEILVAPLLVPSTRPSSPYSAAFDAGQAEISARPPSAASSLSPTSDGGGDGATRDMTRSPSLTGQPDETPQAVRALAMQSRTGVSELLPKEGDEEGDSNYSCDDGDDYDDEDFDDGESEEQGSGSKLVRALAGALTAKGGGKVDEDNYASSTDKLDLAGLLNVLDGVVDSPGRIVIITTNHPEALDAALIRPGRIDKKIHLGYMRYPAAVEMTCHYFDVKNLRLDQEERLRAIFVEPLASSARSSSSRGRGQGRGKITPALVEQLAGEFGTVDSFLEALEALP